MAKKSTVKTARKRVEKKQAVASAPKKANRSAKPALTLVKSKRAAAASTATQASSETKEFWQKAQHPDSRNQFGPQANRNVNINGFRRGKFSGYGGRRAS